MSIKYKIPLAVLLILVLSAAALLLYQRYLIQDWARRGYEKNRHNLEIYNQGIGDGIAKRYPDRKAIEDYLTEEAELKKLDITVYDSKKKVVFNTGSSADAGIPMVSLGPAVMDDNTVYIVEIEKAYLLKNFLGEGILKDTLLFMFILLSIVLLLFAILMHYHIAKPLTYLQRSLSSFHRSRSGISMFTGRRDEIGELSRRFNEMADRLRESSRQQTEMISSISHDLKTPLTSIIGYIERLRMHRVRDQKKKERYYQIVYRKARDIERLVEEFGGYVRNEEECMSLKIERVSVRQFFNSLCEEYSEELKGLGAAFDCTGKPPEKLYIDIDTKKMSRVFANLTANSLKYAGDNVHIAFECSVGRDTVQFLVTDNGEGIPGEELQNIFNRFYRVDKSRSPHRGGTGLGLAICKSIVESHKGTISARNKDTGKGLEICISLPAVK